MIEVDNLNIDSFLLEQQQSFLFQLGAHIKRGYYSLWRNKGYHFLELLMCVLPLFIYIILYYNLLGQLHEKVLSLKELLENNDIFICENNKQFFEESYVGKKFMFY